jgi:hypothetical protein
MNAVDATGALVPKAPGAWGGWLPTLDRSAVVAPDPARDSTEATSKFWGVSWLKKNRRWLARYKDANGKKQCIGLFDTEEQAAHAVNAAIRRAGRARRQRGDPARRPRRPPPHEPGRRRATGAPRAKGAEEAPPRRARRASGGSAPKARVGAARGPPPRLPRFGAAFARRRLPRRRRAAVEPKT